MVRLPMKEVTQKFTVMQISKAKQIVVWTRYVLAGLLVLLSTGISIVSAAEPVFRSPQAALKQGLGAYRGGYYEIAVPALQFAADEDSLLAKYYLAKIYSDNLGSQTDHVRAFRIYRSIVDDYSGIDPGVDPRGLIVGQSITAYAKYVLRGLSSLNLKANPERARYYFDNASTTFNNEDAQFELAKMDLLGDGAPRNRRMARHWLSGLSQKGHPGAQAFLADLLWRGKHMKADPVKALALIVVAVKNASPQERLWIEDIYQTIYCGAPNGVRKQVTGIVADWGKRYSRKVRARPRHAMGGDTGPVRTCQDGEYVGSIWEPRVIAPSDDDSRDLHAPRQPMAAKPQRNDGFSVGGAAGGPTRGGSANRSGTANSALDLRDISTPQPHIR